jgi:hypothetical protein
LATLLTRLIPFLPTLSIDQGDPEVLKTVSDLLMSPVKVLDEDGRDLLISKLRSSQRQLAGGEHEVKMPCPESPAQRRECAKHEV